jgi:hypothetical protein
LEENVGGECWRRMLEENVGGECWRRMLEENVGGNLFLLDGVISSL